MPTVESVDGNLIHYYDSGGTGPAIVLVNGLGGTHTAWRYFTEYFQPTHRMISFDYRGLYRSGPAPRDRLDVEHHAEDLRTVIAATKAERPVLAGWSMGVAVATEYARRYPQDLASLLLMCGSPGRVFETALIPPLHRGILPATRFLGRLDGALSAFLRRLTALQGLPKALVGLGLVSEACDVEAFGDLVREFARLDFRTYFRILERLGAYDGWDVLPKVRVPTLVVAAARDFFTPVHVHERMAKAIPEAELFVIRLGTHYAPVEFPEVLNLRVEKFLRERVANGAPARTA